MGFEDEEGLARPGAAAPVAAPLATRTSLLRGPLEHYAQQMQEGQKTTGFRRLFGGLAQEEQGLQGLKTLAPIYQALRAEQSATMTAQQAVLKYMGDTAKEFHALDEPTKKSSAKFFRSLLARANAVGGLGLDDATLDAAVQSPDFAGIADIYTGGNALWDDEDRGLLQQYLATAKTPEDKIKAKEAAEKGVVGKLDARMRELMPAFVEKVKMSLQRPQAEPITQGELIQAFGKAYPVLSRNPLVQRIFKELRQDDKFLASVGVTSGATAELQAQIPAKAKEAGAIEAAKQLAGAGVGEDYRRHASQLRKELSEGTVTGLSPAQFEAEVNRRIGAERVEISKQTGAAAIELKQTQPVTPEERAKHTDIQALLATGDLVQPPAGITGGDLAKNPRYVAITDKQKEQLGELSVVNQTLASIQGMANRLIAAKTPQDAFAQGLRLHVEAFTKQNPMAATYKDTLKAFLGPLSRSIAKERGVLTDRDIGRIESALTSFFDTVESRDLKHAIVNDIYEVSRRASIAAVAGQATGPFKGRMVKLLTHFNVN